MSDRKDVTFVVDGVEVVAPEGTMLVDAAKHGDVEIPVFCYDPKLGDPVGACRMCLVEIEGIPKLQTGCSTPVRDGMVVYTQNDRVKEAQNAIVEFLLVNHPLDCPVCDKGGECPLQDISMGWGAGKSRVVDPKRHFQKPIPLSPLVKIDRERCILCYRCVRFSQEVSEDEQLQLLERGAKTLVGTYDDRPYVAPFHGNIIELCPVGALTSQAYRFRARPWDIEDAGSVCTLCPSQCNVKFTVRDEQVVRVLARDNAEVDDGWLCDKGRFGYQMFAAEDRLRAPRIRAGGSAEKASWEQALERVAAGLGAARGKVAAIVGGGTSNEEGYLLQRIVRGPLASADVAGTPHAGLPRELRARLAAPELALPTKTIDDAGAILVVGTDPMHEMPILELRVRKAMRRHGAGLLVATERPTALDGGVAIDSTGALAAERYAPGEGGAFLAELVAALGDGGEGPGGFAAALRDAADVVIVWGERLAAGPDGAEVGERLLELADALELGSKPGSGLYEVPVHANGRGLREVGCYEHAGPGYAPTAPGRSADEIRAALEAGELEGLILYAVDPVRDFDDPDGWVAALGAAEFTLSVSMFPTESSAYADVELPAESHGEQEGTVTHPDGRLQRVRPSVPHPGEIRPLWHPLVELSARLGDETNYQSATEVTEALTAEVPFYANLTPDQIGGLGTRWQELRQPEATATVGAAEGDPAGPPAPGAPAGGPQDTQAADAGRPAETDDATRRRTSGGPPAGAPEVGGRRTSGGPPPPAPEVNEPGDGEIRLGTYPDLWADYVAERNPALRFLSPRQTLELGPADAERLGIEQGDEVEVGSNGHSVRARVSLRERMSEGAGFLIDGTREEGANALGGARLVTVRPAEPEPERQSYGGAREESAW